MSYETCIEILDEEHRQAVAGYYRERNCRFDADYVLSEHVAGTLFGYSFCSFAQELSSRRVRTVETEHGPLAVVPLPVLREYTDAYRAFVATRGGKRMDACCRLDVSYEIGNVTTAEDYSDGDIYVSPEDAVEAYRALGSTGHGDTLHRLLDDEVLYQLEELADIVDVLEGAGCAEVGWLPDE